ncbi:protein-glutamate methylesterase/protein-glutamine glutaminase [Methylicorpusculum sp.]|uniref:protein-glutamate methylesterase/protein-glutamine glutaminase n=1 Tax=Methylicorpusculum sp. TaxID=2713644 RepID=UPI00272FA966|nr:chemotaxis response regulator protein-glutamate methylesterase [Methylicorpusculum sp.]MDP2177980.1 chemotaxis response regulator protein-glutamate methylesterase [Methylicorpusculum sp.]MDP3528129.1 chemotaxis response regulator protein-glutamate methylesterase [Methylicorpusculum sp.]MDZ4151384.1 chemotaxis response regulator protein-glutamate methylesterase [Methylicorpusculum sp.]
MRKITVLIVDDSALIRNLLSQILSSSPLIAVVGTASDPYMAREKIKKLNPDVLTLDIEMPKMDGLTFLRNLMRLRPMPVVMVSTLTEQGAHVTLEALAYGAVDFISKPKVDVANRLNEYADEIINKVLMASTVQVRTLDAAMLSSENSPNSGGTSTAKLDPIITGSPKKQMNRSKAQLIALGASTGGTEAIKYVVSKMPASSPAIVITQHLPIAFSQSFANHVNQASEMNACVAQHGQEILPGNIYIAPGDKHLMVITKGSHYVCQLDDGPPVNRHKPSVDILFHSVAQNVGSHAIGVMLTGMGVDGAKGMVEMHDSGAINIIQDESSSVVWGMPGEAYRLGAADYVQPLERIPAQILALKA